MIKTYPRGSHEQISEHFQAYEFDCHCGKCQQTLISETLVDLLEKMREILGCPIDVHDGFRCSARQTWLRGHGFETSAGISTHELGEAADPRTGQHSGALLEIAARKAGFKAVGIARGWVHVDTRDDKVRAWTYKT